MPRWKKPVPHVVEATFRALRAQHPDAHCELVHATPFQLLVATVLSAQTTDVAVNKVTPALFARYPLDLRGGALIENHFPNLLAQIQQLMNGRSPAKPCAAAFKATCSFVKRDVAPLVQVEAALD